MPRTSEASAVTATTAVAVNDVRKTFLLRHTHSLKESFVAMVRGKKISSTFNALNGVDFRIEAGDQVVDLRNGEPGDAEVEVELGREQPGELDGEHLLVPAGVERKLVVGEDIGTLLRGGRSRIASSKSGARKASCSERETSPTLAPDRRAMALTVRP